MALTLSKNNHKVKSKLRNGRLSGSMSDASFTLICVVNVAVNVFVTTIQIKWFNYLLN